MAARFLLRHANGREYPVIGVAYVGRDERCHIVFNDLMVSRFHATLWLQDGDLYVRDERSHNGTYLNGVRLAPGQPARLRPGDELRVGDTRLRAALPGQAVAVPPPPPAPALGAEPGPPPPPAGLPAATAASPAGVPEAGAAAAAGARVTVALIVCPHCATVQPAGKRFCTQCGGGLSGAAVAARAAAGPPGRPRLTPAQAVAGVLSILVGVLVAWTLALGYRYLDPALARVLGEGVSPARVVVTAGVLAGLPFLASFVLALGAGLLLDWRKAAR
jgi:hypothetical protein